MKIVLGVFHTNTYEFLEEIALGFHKFAHSEEWKSLAHFLDENFVDYLFRFIEKYVTEIYFSLDELMYPASQASITIEELNIIHNSPHLWKITTFYQNKQKVDKKEVYEFLNNKFYDSCDRENFPEFTKVNINVESTMDS